MRSIISLCITGTLLMGIAYAGGRETFVYVFYQGSSEVTVYSGGGTGCLLQPGGYCTLRAEGDYISVGPAILPNNQKVCTDQLPIQTEWNEHIKIVEDNGNWSCKKYPGVMAP